MDTNGTRDSFNIFFFFFLFTLRHILPKCGENPKISICSGEEERYQYTCFSPFQSTGFSDFKSAGRGSLDRSGVLIPPPPIHQVSQDMITSGGSLLPKSYKLGSCVIATKTNSSSTSSFLYPLSKHLSSYYPLLSLRIINPSIPSSSRSVKLVETRLLCIRERGGER